MKAIFDKETHYYKYTYTDYSSNEVQEGEPYDYKIDVGDVLLVKENETYKALKSYEKGKQYYGN